MTIGRRFMKARHPLEKHMGPRFNRTGFRKEAPAAKHSADEDDVLEVVPEVLDKAKKKYIRF